MRSQGLRIGLVVALALGAAVVTATAQIGDEDPCRAACREENDRCVQLCEEHSNPMECEARCEEQAEKCEEACSP